MDQDLSKKEKNKDSNNNNDKNNNDNVTEALNNHGDNSVCSLV